VRYMSVSGCGPGLYFSKSRGRPKAADGNLQEIQ
jgi:hypothetical protein